MPKHPELVRGDVMPDMLITISDAREDADFSVLTAGDCIVVGEMDGTVVFEKPATVIDVAADNNSAVVRRPWDAEDTDVDGILWVRVRVNWPGNKQQTFPRGAPLRVDIVRAAGDA